MYQNKKLKLKLVVAVLTMTVLSGYFVPAVTIVNASEIAETTEHTVQIIKNEKMLALERELNSPEMKVKLASGTLDEEKAFHYFVEKYDGAEVQHVVGRNAAFSEKFYIGGYNVFASNRSALQYGRSELATTATLLQVNGTLGGSLVGGPAGALLGLLGATILAGRFRSGSNTMRRWIDVGSTRGGSRMTLTEEFPIASLSTTSQSSVKPL